MDRSADSGREISTEAGAAGSLARAAWLYYRLRPAVPRPLQIGLRRWWCRLLLRRYRAVWPIDPAAAAVPEGWPGWPEGRRFAVVLTHDVDTLRGLQHSLRLARLERDLGFRSVFNFVPERYPMDHTVRRELVAMGFEIGVHGLNHDGKLFASREVFEARARRINAYLKDWNAVGFRAPAMHHNLEWLRLLDIEYDLSTFDTDPFEPQPDGAGTIFPFWVGRPGPPQGFLELPYTLAQDFTLFVLLGERGIALWRRKLRWIAAAGGLVLVNVHPDYLAFEDETSGMDTYPIALYRSLLLRLKAEYADQYWHGLPRDLTHSLLHSGYGLVRGATAGAAVDEGGR